MDVSDTLLCLDSLDPYGCQALLNQGKWLDTSQSYQAPSFRNWQVPGCMIHEYDATDITRCLRSQRIVFVGDSTVRDIFWAAAKKLNHRAAVEEEAVAQKHQSQTFTQADIVVDFIWDPYLNSTELHKQLLTYQNSWDPNGESLDTEETPAILLIGGGLWHMRHLGEAFLTEYKASMENVLRHEAPGGSPRWGSLFDSHRRETEHSNNLMAIAPVQHPSYESLSPLAKENVTPDKVNEVNDYLQAVSSSNQASVALGYQSMTAAPKLGLKEDGLHVNENIVNRELDILLNLRCNARLLRSKMYPMDKTCCGIYAPPNWVQSILMISSLGFLLCAIFLLVYGAQPNFIYLRECLRYT